MANFPVDMSMVNVHGVRESETEKKNAMGWATEEKKQHFRHSNLAVKNGEEIPPTTALGKCFQQAIDHAMQSNKNKE